MSANHRARAKAGRHRGLDPTPRLVALSRRHRFVIEAYYLAGRSLADIGAELGVTESRVCQIHTKALRQMRAIRFAQSASHTLLCGVSKSTTSTQPVGCLFTKGSDVAFTQNTKDRRLEIAGLRLEHARRQAEKVQFSQDHSASSLAQLAALNAKVAAAQSQVDYLHSVVVVDELSPEKIAVKVAAAQRVLDRYGPVSGVEANGRDQRGRFSAPKEPSYAE